MNKIISYFKGIYDFVLGHIHSHPGLYEAHRLQVRHPYCCLDEADGKCMLFVLLIVHLFYKAIIYFINTE